MLNNRLSHPLTCSDLPRISPPHQALTPTMSRSSPSAVNKYQLVDGRCNRLTKTLYMRLFLKANRQNFIWTCVIETDTIARLQGFITELLLSSMSADYIIILGCRKVLIVYRLLFLFNIGTDSDKTVCETIYTTAFFQVCTVCSKCAICNICLWDAAVKLKLKRKKIQEIL